MAAWTPADLGASLLGWFDVNDAATVIVTGSGVSQWVNKAAGSPFTFTQGIDSLRPAYVPGIIGFSGTQNLAAGSPPAAYDVLIAGRPLGSPDWQTLYLSSDGSGTENTILVEATVGHRIGAFQTDFGPAGGLTWPVNADGLVYARVSSAGPITLSRDGGPLNSTGLTHNASLPIQGLGGAGSYGAHTYSQSFGWVYELIFVPYNASDDTRQRLEGYAAWKWGLQALLPADHPYKAAPPTVGAPAGGTVDLAGNLSPSISFAADVADLFSLAGDLTPSLAFAADLTIVSVSYVDLAGNFAPGVAFTADLTVAVDTRVYVDFSGNLGGVSQYGKLKYGLKHYSRIDAFAPAFSADLDIVGQIFFAGDFKPVVTFNGALSFAVDLSSGDLAPVVTFSATIGLQIDLSGDLAPQIDLGASLSLDLPLAALDGSFGFTVVLATSSLISGPLWASSEPCPAPPWTASEPCPPSMWTPVPPPTFVPPSGGWTKQEEEDDLPVWGDAT